MAIAYLNGTWLAPEDARVSVFDRGFMFGDGVYEVLAIYQGLAFLLDEHVQRLERSLAEIRLASPLTGSAWSDLIKEAIARNQAPTASLYLQVTRGPSMPRSPDYPAPATPTIFITVMPSAITLEESLEEHIEEPTPYKLMTQQDFRWGRGDIKGVSLLANGLLRNEAQAAGYDDAVLIRDGLVTETTHANVFIVKDETIITPPKSCYILHGITRQHILQLARTAGLAVEEREITKEELLDADEVWISSTRHELLPVSEVNAQQIGEAVPGGLWREVNALFQASKPTVSPSTKDARMSAKR